MSFPVPAQRLFLVYFYSFLSLSIFLNTVFSPTAGVLSGGSRSDPVTATNTHIGLVTQWGPYTAALKLTSTHSYPNRKSGSACFLFFQLISCFSSPSSDYWNSFPLSHLFSQRQHFTFICTEIIANDHPFETQFTHKEYNLSICVKC